MPEQNLTALGKFKNAVQLAGFHYIVCLKTRPTNADYRLKFEKAEFVFQSISEAETSDLHFEFQRWASAAVLRDLIEGFSIFLTEVYGDAIHANPNENYTKNLTSFERCGIEEQLIILNQNFSIDRRWIKALVSFNRMRNCLAHRQGKVGKRDCTDCDELVVSWFVTNVTPTDVLAESLIEDVGSMSGLIVAKQISGETVEIATIEREKRFATGTLLNFSPNEIFEICTTILQHAVAFSAIGK